MTEVVAAVIWQDDKFLICQRPPSKGRCPLGWEFPGGKVEPGETKQAALVREIQEELNTTITVGEEVADVVYEYPHITVHITFFNCTIFSGMPQTIEHNDIRWITKEEIGKFQFCPADEKAISKIFNI